MQIIHNCRQICFLNKPTDGLNPSPAEPRYVLKKPTDLDLHFVIKYVNLYQQPGSSNLIG